MITSEQIRAGRALLGISALELAKIAGIGSATLKRIEISTGLPSSNLRTIIKIKSALELQGIEFIGEPTNRPGVRLNKPPTAHD